MNDLKLLSALSVFFRIYSHIDFLLCLIDLNYYSFQDSQYRHSGNYFPSYTCIIKSDWALLYQKIQ